MQGIRSVGLLVLSGLAFVGLGAPARAVIVEPSGDIVTVTFTGTVSDSSDPDGILGCTGGADACSDNPYDGDTYTAVYTFNTGVGYTSSTGPSIYAKGGSSMPPDIRFGGPPPAPPPSPLLSDEVTISTPGGTVIGTYSVDVSYDATLENDASGGVSDPPYTLSAVVMDANGNEIDSSVTSSDIPFSITTPFSGDFGDAAFSNLSFDCTGGNCAGFVSADMSVGLVNDSTVPEASTWIMMAVGFAGLGLAGYRRARTAEAIA